MAVVADLVSLEIQFHQRLMDQNLFHFSALRIVKSMKKTPGDDWKRPLCTAFVRYLCRRFSPLTHCNPVVRFILLWNNKITAFHASSFHDFFFRWRRDNSITSLTKCDTRHDHIEGLLCALSAVDKMSKTKPQQSFLFRDKCWTGTKISNCCFCFFLRDDEHASYVGKAKNGMEWNTHTHEKKADCTKNVSSKFHSIFTRPG